MKNRSKEATDDPYAVLRQYDQMEMARGMANYQMPFTVAMLQEQVRQLDKKLDAILELLKARE